MAMVLSIIGRLLFAAQRLAFFTVVFGAVVVASSAMIAADPATMPSSVRSRERQGGLSGPAWAQFIAVGYGAVGLLGMADGLYQLLG